MKRAWSDWMSGQAGDASSASFPRPRNLYRWFSIWLRRFDGVFRPMTFALSILSVSPPRIDKNRWKGWWPSWISKKAGRCGADACIRDTRITVWGLISYRRLGTPDAIILAAVQVLTPDDLQAAWEYAAQNPAEIDRAIQENEEGEEGFVE